MLETGMERSTNIRIMLAYRFLGASFVPERVLSALLTLSPDLPDGPMSNILLHTHSMDEKTELWRG